MPHNPAETVSPAVFSDPQAGAVLPLGMAGAVGLAGSTAAHPIPTVSTEQTAAVSIAELLALGGSSELIAEASAAVAQNTFTAMAKQPQMDAKPHNAANSEAGTLEEHAIVKAPFHVSRAAHPQFQNLCNSGLCFGSVLY